MQDAMPGSWQVKSGKGHGPCDAMRQRVEARMQVTRQSEEGDMANGFSKATRRPWSAHYSSMGLLILQSLLSAALGSELLAEGEVSGQWSRSLGSSEEYGLRILAATNETSRGRRSIRGSCND